MRWLIVAGLFAYRRWLSPWLGGGCRFTPSCSEYALEAVKRFGTLRGIRLTLSRLRRCQPDTPCGMDPVPCQHEIQAALQGQLVAAESRCAPCGSIGETGAA